MGIKINFNEKTGIIKPMHAVNNGPVYKFGGADQRISNLEAFREAGIPYARNHDASFYSTYGGEHTVDIHLIFPNFDADPYDEGSYDFACTDEYIRVTELAGVKTYYRLGSKIEHGIKKYGTLPPKDFKKWAVICEHIIKHYNYGWANGFNYNLEYWEIWNEPDLDDDDSTNKRTWGGTKEEFFELYDVAATHLKNCFPELKIGGPAIAGKLDWAEDFLKQLKAPLDFFSWHIYAYDACYVQEKTYVVQELLNKYGYENAESILNEWNYVKGWEGDEWIYSLKTMKNMKGAAFIAAVMCLEQKSPLDMLMYYDARPCGMNGMFGDIVSEKLKGYYPFYAFNVLYKLHNEVSSESDDDKIAVCAAENDGEGAIMLSYFDDNDEAEEKTVEINVNGWENGAEVDCYVLDEEHDLELVRGETFTASQYKIILKLKLNSMVLIKVKKR